MSRKVGLYDEGWQQRFRAPQVLTSGIAWAAPACGIAATNISGLYQLYRWDVASGAPTQLTHRAEGLVQGTISPDGHFVYYFDDRQGQEIGHFVRLPYDATEGSEPQDITPDITPDMLPYSLSSSPGGLAICRAGTRLAFLAADQQGFDLCAIDIQPDGSLDVPRRLFHNASDALGSVLSRGGEIGIIASDERMGKSRFSLRAFDMASGREIAELWDGPASSLELIAFSPAVGDTRLLALTNCTGIETLLIWDPISGQRTDLILPDVEGATRAFDWSPGGSRIVLRTLEQAAQQFYVYNVATETLTRLNHPSGTYRNAYFASDQEIFVHHSDSTHPTQLVALDAATGNLRRTVLAAGKVTAGHPSARFRSRRQTASGSSGGWRCLTAKVLSRRFSKHMAGHSRSRLIASLPQARRGSTMAMPI
jgi:hypothetical protein